MVMIGDGVKIQSATVTTPDVDTTNGVIHIIGAVITPPSMLEPFWQLALPRNLLPPPTSPLLPSKPASSTLWWTLLVLLNWLIPSLARVPSRSLPPPIMLSRPSPGNWCHASCFPRIRLL